MKLLMLSGGLDSTLCLFKLAQLGEKVRVHHISLQSNQGRHPYEDNAVRHILEWFRLSGAKIKYTSSVWAYGPGMHRVLDVNIWANVAAIVMQESPQLDTLVVPRHADAFNHLKGEWETHANASDAKILAMAKAVHGREIKIECPIADLTKQQIVEALPPVLRKLCWYCRTPKAGKPCRKCITCVQVVT